MYLDPGFGGMLLQVIVVIAAVGGAILFSLRKKLKQMFSKGPDSQPANNNISSADIEDDAVDVLND